MMQLRQEISDCRLCAERFAQTHTAHRPRPVVWFQPDARILIAGQAPGIRVHESGKPFDDHSGVRLRQWLGMSDDEFYDRSRVAIIPMAFCFPGYDAKGSDLPPPKLCGSTWHDQVMRDLPDLRLSIIIGGYSQKYHMGAKTGVTETVRGWRDHAPHVFPLPHPSWRNTAWLKKNPWFEAELMPDLQTRVREVLNDG
ncbi:MAG: uracil-DNA glycosylase family protein [Pseudomonadota bacterium]